MKEATAEGYDYYHLLSGVDLPIKSKEEIMSFFEENNPVQYVHFERPVIQNKYLNRIKYYYPFQEKERKSKVCYYLGKGFEQCQKKIKINRINSLKETIQFGSNWFSITHDCAVFILQKEKWINKVFRCGHCVDELFVQSVLVNSDFKNNLVDNAFSGEYSSCLRYIDWKRGNPYCFRKSDFDDLINSNYLFARKFDLNVDSEIIDMVYRHFI